MIGILNDVLLVIYDRCTYCCITSDILLVIHSCKLISRQLLQMFYLYLLYCTVPNVDLESTYLSNLIYNYSCRNLLSTNSKQ